MVLFLVITTSFLIVICSPVLRIETVEIRWAIQKFHSTCSIDSRLVGWELG